MNEDRIGKLKRFWLFGGIKFYPSGGLEDFKKSYDSLEEAVHDAERKEFSSIEYSHMHDRLEWYQILDTQINEVVTHSGNFFGNPDRVQEGKLIEVDSRLEDS